MLLLVLAMLFDGRPPPLLGAIRQAVAVLPRTAAQALPATGVGIVGVEPGVLHFSPSKDWLCRSVSLAYLLVGH